MKFSQTTEPARSGLLAAIKERSVQLLRLVEQSELRALQYLLFTNAGGAIAILGFMGSSESARAMYGPRYALGFFLVGIILAGILVARGVHHMSGLLQGYMTDVPKYYKDEIDWDELYERDKDRVGTNFIVYVLGYAAFLCFIIGAVIGYLKLWSF